MTSRLAEFEISGELGEGGSAVVYDATTDGRRVALKVLREDLALSEREKQRFVEEARRMVAVDHPGLVKLERAGVLPDGRPYLAMPFLAGRSLSRRLEDGPLPLAEAVRVFGVLARAVDALHASGIVHRDIKPENILLVDDADGPRPVLLDFGIARDVDARASTTTSAGKIRGTPAYMAPERFFGTPASPLSDVYELGVTLYMILVGRLPWGSAENVSDRLAPTVPPGLEPAIGRALARAMLRALSTRPEQRPASAGAFAEEIERAFEVPETEATHTTETFAAAPTVPDVRAITVRPPAVETRKRSPFVYLLPIAAGAGLAFGITRGSSAPANDVASAAASAPVTAPSALPAPASAGAPAAAATTADARTTATPEVPSARPARARPAAAPAKSAKPGASGDAFLEDRK